MLSKFQTTQCEINTQFEVCYCSDLTLTADKHLLNNESEMCVGPTADSPLTPKAPNKNCSRRHFIFYFYLSIEIRLDVSCEPSAYFL